MEQRSIAEKVYYRHHYHRHYYHRCIGSITVGIAGGVPDVATAVRANDWEL
jgi:hypothetical protein